MSERGLRLGILGGWLGAGKTTWLRHRLHAGLSAHVLVNEAAGVAVDDALLAGAQGLTVLPGGCACCAGWPELRAALVGLADRATKGEVLPDLVLETSGLADPGAILAAIAADPILAHHVRITGTTVLVDARHGAEALAEGALAGHQIRAADRLILTKTDAAPPLAVARLVATLKAINPGAQVSAAVAGVPVPLPQMTAEPLPLGDGTREVTAITLPLPPGADWPALSLWLGALLHAHGQDLMRIKGVVVTPAGRLLLQAVRGTMAPPERLAAGAGEDNRLAVIGHAPDADRLARSLARFLG